MNQEIIVDDKGEIEMKKKKNNKVKKSIMIFMIMSMMVGLITGCGKEKTENNQGDSKDDITIEKVIYLNDYIDVSYKGQNGQGWANLNNVDYWRSEVYPELLREIDRYAVGMYDEDSLRETLYGIDNHFEFPIFAAPEKGAGTLSNGDTVHIVWGINERGFQLLQEQVPNVKFVWEDFDDVVSGLEE